jgi:hypothetical protein
MKQFLPYLTAAEIIDSHHQEMMQQELFMEVKSPSKTKGIPCKEV